jgi:hypothetical protein
MADVTIRGPDCDDEEGDRGHRGRRGRHGPTGPTGTTGTTGPTGPSGGGGSFAAFQYTVTGLEPDLTELTITFPVPRVNLAYGIAIGQQQATALLASNVATASKTLLNFVLTLSAPATAGDIFTIFVADL